MTNKNINLTWSRLPRDLINEHIRLNLTPNLVLPDVHLTTHLPDVVENLQQKQGLEQISSPNTHKPIRTKSMLKCPLNNHSNF